MKRILIVSALIASCCMIITGCKEQPGAGSIEKNVFITSGDGAAVKKSPDLNSESLGRIPFGSEIVVSESTAPDDAAKGWVSTKWKSGQGWIKNDLTGSDSKLLEAVHSSYEGAGAYLSSAMKGLFEGTYTVKKIFFYTGGEMEPATMILLSNGVMAVNSTIFSEKMDIYFFRYEFLGEGKLLKIYFDDDSRAVFADYSAVESGAAGVFKIDQAGKSITYQVKNSSFSFLNWVFKEVNTGVK